MIAKFYEKRIRTTFHTAQLSVRLWSPQLSLAFHFVCAPGWSGAGHKMEGTWKVSLYVVAVNSPNSSFVGRHVGPQAAAVNNPNSSFCWRTTFRNHGKKLGSVTQKQNAMKSKFNKLLWLHSDRRHSPTPQKKGAYQSYRGIIAGRLITPSRHR